MLVKGAIGSKTNITVHVKWFAEVTIHARVVSFNLSETMLVEGPQVYSVIFGINFTSAHMAI